jgi:hypothetical protein
VRKHGTLLPGHLRIEIVGGKVSSVGPTNGPPLRIYAYLQELVPVFERRENSFESDHVSEIDLTLHSILKAKAKSVLLRGLHPNNVLEYSFTPAVESA